MPLKVTAYGDTLIRRQSASIDEIDSEINELIDNMSSTMRFAKGVGLAAPQVGVSKMLFLIDWTELEENGKIKAYINPEILAHQGEMVSEQEGCLSLPEVWAEVDRKESVKVRYTNLEGEIVEEELTGLPSRVFQHEFDHLLGILFIDRISREERLKLKDKLQAIMDGEIKPFDGEIPPETGESDRSEVNNH